MRLLVLTAALLTTTFAVAQTDTVDATITVDNVGASAYLLTAAEGGTVGEVGTENAAWALEVGKRYRVVNNGELLFHPFELRSDAGVLLAQGDAVGTLEGDPGVAFVSDAAGVTFTLTPELAALLTSYRCTYHPVMTGTITVEVAS